MTIRLLEEDQKRHCIHYDEKTGECLDDNVACSLKDDGSGCDSFELKI